MSNDRDPWEQAGRREAKGPARTALALVGVAVAIQILFLNVLLWGPRRHVPAPPVPDPLDDEIVDARLILAEERDYGEAIKIGRSALEQRGPRADAYAVIGEGYLKMGKMDEARRHLYQATISPGADEDRLRARDLLESLFK